MDENTTSWSKDPRILILQLSYDMRNLEKLYTETKDLNDKLEIVKAIAIYIEKIIEIEKENK